MNPGAVPPAHRTRALHEAVLAICSQAGGAPETTAPLVTGVVARAVEVLGAAGGAIALAEHPAWSGLVPGTTAADGHVMLRHTGEAERRLQRPGGTALRALEGHPAQVTDTAAPEHDGAYDWLVASGIRSFTIVPMRAGARG